jgi:glycine/sarcosine N-methyltransferase
VSDLFDNHSELYDQMIDWPHRLANEAPFYRQLFDQHGVRRLLDCACGTGHHAAMFAQWGLSVVGTDLSEEMIARCQEEHGQHSRLRWQARSFENLQDFGEPFDAVICVGNSLALAGDKQTCRNALESMMQALRPGGVMIIHVLNFWSLRSGSILVQKFLPLQQARHQALLLKLFHRVASHGHVETFVLSRSDAAGSWTMQHHNSELVGLSAAWFRHHLSSLGFPQIELWGDYHFAPYHARKSPDLIVTGLKGT